MRTYRAKFSGGGTLLATCVVDITPDTWEATGAPERLQELGPYCGVGSIEGVLEHEAEMAGQTVQIESDDGPVEQFVM